MAPAINPSRAVAPCSALRLCKQLTAMQHGSSRIRKKNMAQSNTECRPVTRRTNRPKEPRRNSNDTERPAAAADVPSRIGTRCQGAEHSGVRPASLCIPSEGYAFLPNALCLIYPSAPRHAQQRHDTGHRLDQADNSTVQSTTESVFRKIDGQRSAHLLRVRRHPDAENPCSRKRSA